MKIAIGADHGGFELKQQIIDLVKTLGYQVDDLGCHTSASVDYPRFAEAVCEKIVESNADFGILVCGTGIGMSIAANRHRQIRAALCHDDYTARMSREHNNANVLCLGARVIGQGVAEDIVKVWLTTEFAGGRHLPSSVINVN
jgi:ribose 5-phosphate isomerase B